MLPIQRYIIQNEMVLSEGKWGRLKQLAIKGYYIIIVIR